MYQFYNTIKDAIHSKYIFEDKLGISARKLEGGTVEWPNVVSQVLELQRSGEYRIAINNHGLDSLKDELVVAQRIMRKENFMIAFFNQNLFDLSIPLPWKRGVEKKSNMIFYSRSIEVCTNVYLCYVGEVVFVLLCGHIYYVDDSLTYFCVIDKLCLCSGVFTFVY